MSANNWAPPAAGRSRYRRNSGPQNRGNNTQPVNFDFWKRATDRWKLQVHVHLNHLNNNKLSVDDYGREKSGIDRGFDTCNGRLDELDVKVTGIEEGIRGLRNEFNSFQTAWAAWMGESDEEIGAVEKKVGELEKTLEKKLDTRFKNLGNFIARNRHGNGGGSGSSPEKGSTVSHGPIAGSQQAAGDGADFKGGIGNNHGNWQGFIVNTNGGSFHAQNCGQFGDSIQGQCSCMHWGAYGQPATVSTLYTPYIFWPSYSTHRSSHRHWRRSGSGSGSLNWNQTPDITLDLSQKAGGGLFSKPTKEHMFINVGKGCGGGGSGRLRGRSAYDSYH